MFVIDPRPTHGHVDISTCQKGWMLPNQQWMNSFTTDTRPYHSLVTSDKEVMFSVALVCLLATLHKKLGTDFHEIFMKGGELATKQMIIFWR